MFVSLKIEFCKFYLCVVEAQLHGSIPASRSPLSSLLYVYCYKHCAFALSQQLLHLTYRRWVSADCGTLNRQFD